MKVQRPTLTLAAVQRVVLIGVLFIAGCSSISAHREPHPATATDAPADPNNPAGVAGFTIVSNGAKINALLYLASGAKKHPTMLLLHGTPGYDGNIDLAQAARRAGWNVLVFHYRGSWGSEGDYTLSNAISDTTAAMNFLFDPKNVDKYKIDVKKLVIAGHSTGGFNAAVYAAGHPQIAGVALIDAWNAAPAKEPYAASARNEFIARIAQGIPSLVIRTPEAYVDDFLAQKPLITLAKDLSALPVLIVAAERANGASNKALAEAIRGVDGRRLQVAILPADHYFSDRRVELTDILLKWLDTISSVPS